MTMHTALLLNGILDLGIALAVAAVMRSPFTFDRRREQATVYALADPLPVELAA